jgi:ketosteroid isomerase-like protein
MRRRSRERDRPDSAHRRDGNVSPRVLSQPLSAGSMSLAAGTSQHRTGASMFGQFYGPNCLNSLEMNAMYAPGVNHAQLVREAWDAVSRGDFDAVESMFAADAKWRAVEEGPWNCESRAQIVTVMRDNRARRILEGDVEDVVDVGERAVVAFRPTSQGPGGWPLDDGIRYVVLSFRDGLVTEMKGCASRRVALDYAKAV